MPNYKLLPGGGVLLNGTTSIPPDESNPDWRVYLEFFASGGKPEPEFNLAELKVKRKAELEAAARQRVEETRREADYQASTEKADAENAAAKIDAAKTNPEIEKAFAEAMR